MKKNYIILIALLIVVSTNSIIGQEFKLPEFNANLELQLESFDGDEMEPFAGYETPTSRFSIRHASIEALGKIGEKFEYGIEAGTATCLAGGQFTLMDASVLYKPLEYLKVGFIKGEILRGFHLSRDCGELLTAEKLRFAKTLAPCHPTGAIVELDYTFENNYGVLLQIAYLNGKETGNIDEEYDQNIGLILTTPIKGLAFGGYYNRIKANYGTGEGPDYTMQNGNGMRMGFGAGYEANNFTLRGEYYLLEGFYNNPFSGTLYEDEAETIYINSEDLEMNAFYLESGYSVKTGLEELVAIQPYLRYQFWDKATNAYGDHKVSFVTMGINFWMDKNSQTLFRIDYESQLVAPDGVEKDASLLIVRLQKGF